MKKYSFIITLLLSLFLLTNPLISNAESNENLLTMEELTIQVMPEFAYHPNDEKNEHPPLLIGYQGTMLNHSDQPLKGQIEIPLPLEEKNFRIGYVADYSSDLSRVYDIEYIIDTEKGTISWVTSEEIQPNEIYKFVVEFYTDNIVVDKKNRSLPYQFKSFADIGLCNVSFVQPLKAEKIKLDPAPEEKKTHADEEGIFSYHYQGIKAGDEKNFLLEYQRGETMTTIEMVETPNKGINEMKENESATKLAIATFSGVSLLAAGIITLLMRRRKQS
ncbi:hypothetical protein [Bacillus sp. MRMR6]|uniref:hypothetical protein n=1 Tax=Bacillus sp. MRMR6 TaxID=1928617 RepID=UPI0009534BDF|nr:hypothetical protein [Bacillus sp. MRMR6]OLS35835.1 hypothetical protein BTR25_19025 [Bacillus sp. MRMR6]